MFFIAEIFRTGRDSGLSKEEVQAEEREERQLAREMAGEKREMSVRWRNKN